jgi:hypothetical protein
VNIASGTVLSLAALASSPALVQAGKGELSLDIALTRYLIAVVVVWAALCAVEFLVGAAPTPTRTDPRLPAPAVDDRVDPDRGDA